MGATDVCFSPKADVSARSESLICAHDPMRICDVRFGQANAAGSLPRGVGREPEAFFGLEPLDRRGLTP